MTSAGQGLCWPAWIYMSGAEGGPGCLGQTILPSLMLYLCPRLCWPSPKILRVSLLCGTYDIEQYGKFHPPHTGTRPIDYMAQEGVLVGFYFQIHTALSHLGRGNLT